MATEFQKGDKVQSISDPSRIGVVTGSRPDHAGEHYYEVTWLATGITRVVPGNDLRPFGSGTTPIENLARGNLAGYQEFQRLVTRQRLSRENPLRNNIAAYNASRICFYPHQFRPLLKFVDSPNGRLLIADEVGLGKTIEAGLVLTELRARHDVERVLVVCPSSLREKWRREMKDKFDMKFDIYDTKALMEVLDDYERDPDRSRFYGIVSLETIRQDAVRERLSVVSPDFDMVIVDEAHHMRNFETKQRKVGVVLSSTAMSMLMLTATPVHIGNENLFSLLNILDADSFPDQWSTEQQLRANEPIVLAQRMLARADVNIAAVIEVLQPDRLAPSIKSNPAYDDVMARLGEAQAAGKDTKQVWRRMIVESQRSLAELNLIGHILTRTRKREVETDAPRRRPRTYRRPFSAVEQKLYDNVTDFIINQMERHGTRGIPVQWVLNSYQRRMASSIPAMVESICGNQATASDVEDVELPDDVDESEIDSAHAEFRAGLAAILRRWPAEAKDTKYELFKSALDELRSKEPTGKVMVFAFFKPTLYYLKRRLADDGFDVHVVTGDVPPGLRPDILERFRLSDKFSVLLSSRVGSEGLDFQFCATMFNYDLPWNPMEVEQRIGRLDRIGQQSKVIVIGNLWMEGTIEDRIFRRLYERIGIFERSIGNLEPILGDVIGTLEREVLSKRLTPQEQLEKVEQAERAILTKRAELDKLEADSAKFVGADLYFSEELAKVSTHRRYVTPEQLYRFLADFIRNYCPRARFSYDRLRQLGELVYDAELKQIVTKYCNANRVPLPVMPDRAPRKFTLESTAAFRNPEVEFVNVLHPLVGAALKQSEEGCQSVNAQHVCLKTDRLPAGYYFYFVFRLDIRAARSQSTLEMILFDSELNEWGDADATERLLGEMVENGLDPSGPHLEVVPARMEQVAERARDSLMARMDELKREYGRTNDAFIEKRLATVRLSYQRNIRKQQDLLARGREEGKDKRYLRLREAMISRYENELAAKEQELNEKRKVVVEYEEVCAGILEVVQ